MTKQRIPLDSPATLERSCELETFYDLCVNYGTDCALGNYWCEDSRSAMDVMLRWANEFNTLHHGREWDGEYMEEIDAFYLLKRDEYKK